MEQQVSTASEAVEHGAPDGRLAAAVLRVQQDTLKREKKVQLRSNVF
jgi:hypothetical protein